MAAHRKDIHRKVNQKCIDTYNKKLKIKNERMDGEDKENIETSNQ